MYDLTFFEFHLFLCAGVLLFLIFGIFWISLYYLAAMASSEEDTRVGMPSYEKDEV